MNTLTPTRQQIIELIDKLTTIFLLSILGLGAPTEKDVSDRYEELLANEMNPIRGWSIDSDTEV